MTDDFFDYLRVCVVFGFARRVTERQLVQLLFLFIVFSIQNLMHNNKIQWK